MNRDYRALYNINYGEIPAWLKLQHMLLVDDYWDIVKYNWLFLTLLASVPWVNSKILCLLDLQKEISVAPQDIFQALPTRHVWPRPIETSFAWVLQVVELGVPEAEACSMSWLPNTSNTSNGIAVESCHGSHGMIRSPLWEAPEAALPVPRPDQPGARPEGHCPRTVAKQSLISRWQTPMFNFVTSLHDFFKFHIHLKLGLVFSAFKGVNGLWEVFSSYRIQCPSLKFS